MLAPRQNAEARRQAAHYAEVRRRMNDAGRRYQESKLPPKPRDNVIRVPFGTAVRVGSEGLKTWAAQVGPYTAKIEIFRPFTLPNSWKRSCWEIANEVSDHFGTAVIDTFSERRDKKIALARHVTWWRCRWETTRSFPEIAKFFGDRDHTTVLHAVKKIDALIASGELSLPEGWGRAG